MELFVCFRTFKCRHTGEVLRFMTCVFASRRLRLLLRTALRQKCKHSNQQQIGSRRLERHCCWRQGSVKPTSGVQSRAGRGGRDGKTEGGRSLTDKGESVTVSDTTRSTDGHRVRGQRRSAADSGGQRFAEGSKRDCDSCGDTQEKLRALSARMWCLDSEHEQNSTGTVCECNRRLNDRI